MWDGCSWRMGEDRISKVVTNVSQEKEDRGGILGANGLIMYKKV